MQTDHESTRAAFEAKYNTPCERRENGEYVEPIHQTGWEHWCRALDYAAQQQLAPSEHVCALHMDMTGRCSVCGAVNESIRAAQEADEARHRAEQQTAPAPLPRPDKPGWWWRWLDHGAEPSWHAERITNNDVVWYSRDGSRPGLWLPATPPPAPNA